MISLTINDKKIEVEEGLTLLKAAEKAGIRIPTLCSHKALSPYGACRLCLVEVNRGEGSPEIQASCTYPAIEGLMVQTDSQRVIKTRKIVIELLLARCPDSEEIKNLAKELGVEKTRIKPKDKDCTLCGLCVRMCEERMGRAAISFSGRGPRREVTSPFGKPSDVCQACGACDFICPTGKIRLHEVSKNEPHPIPFEHNMGLNSRPAVYIPYPQAIPNKATIDSRYCIHILRDKCEICKEFCEAEAINYDQKEEKLDLKVGSIIFSPGYDLFDAGSKLEYGYSNYSNVITALEFERILSASGPYEGKVLRPSDKLIPKKIAFIQCVGSRDTERDYCSSICCMYATKEAIIAKEHAGEELECQIFFIDMRAFGKGFDAYYERAKELGVKYIRCRPSSVEEIAETKNLKINYVTDEGKMLTDQYDLVVLSVGLQPPELARKLNSNFGIKLNEYGFCWTDPFKPVESNKEGIFVCGPFTEPKDIPETVMQAGGAASKVLSLLSEARGTLIKAKEYPLEKDVTGQAPRIGVFICHCGTNIAGVVDISQVVEYAKNLPDVVYVENNLYTCSNDTQEKIKKLVEEHNLNRVVVASCTPRTHEPLFRNTIREARLNPYLFEMANIRDQCSWVHMHEPEKATRKAKDLVRMAVAKVRLLEPLQRRKVGINHSALVIGGGLSGMSTALEIAEQGYDVHLVEKEKQLGGNLQRIHFLFNGGKPQEQLDSLIKRVKENDKIHLYTDTKISNIEGSFGNFKTTIETDNTEQIKESGNTKKRKRTTNNEINHGVVIVATGAKEYKPTEYLYSEDEKVITQLQLEEWLAANSEQSMVIAEHRKPGTGSRALSAEHRHSSANYRLPKTDPRTLKTVVMIQCVGSRDDERPYCSRVCCSEAVKNALKIKEVNPKTNVFILYRDMRTYGFRESYYTKARQMGVIFIRYDKDKKPEVVEKNGVLKVSLVDPILNRLVTINADLLVLSAGTIPHPENKDLAQMLKVPLDQDKFFLEAHMKLRPVDFATDGVFLCGLAHSAKSIEESITQACGAAARASTILSKDTVELEANISFVVDENCDGCAYCIDPCPYKALTLIEYMKDGAIKKTVEVEESTCKGCGTCMATCPKMGIFVKGFKLEQISAQVEAALQSTEA
ncbi:MAG: FAD-dependent oxidoreductase [Candidatus Hydromicrobium sp.]